MSGGNKRPYILKSTPKSYRFIKVGITFFTTKHERVGKDALET